MLQNIDLKNILFLDIETVPEQEDWNTITQEKQVLFEEKTKYQRKGEFTSEEFYERAGIWAEFGKIICISVAYFIEKDDHRQLRVTSFSNTNEYELLINFKELLDTHFNLKKHLLCAHNGKEFDFPYIARRMIIHGIELPEKLNLFGKKPWEIHHLDTLDLWKFGDYKHYTSLNLLTHILGIPSPKQDIDGSQVANIYYKAQDLDRIIRYCEQDTIAVAQLLLRFNNLPILENKNIQHIRLQVKSKYQTQ
ncbi:3'-5' exonuclease [Tenacibaculum agarivorans]|uniref:3'-5' exonuclease n=1 Tax=Tenacibaculum agarivorans TaxID=1908389 RepID=UPI00094B7DA3|nr:3'-5' exonuclease [Tenacibaculum agarivorans]